MAKLSDSQTHIHARIQGNTSAKRRRTHSWNESRAEKCCRKKEKGEESGGGSEKEALKSEKEDAENDAIISRLLL